jgi:hypothetical protein
MPDDNELVPAGLADTTIEVTLIFENPEIAREIEKRLRATLNWCVPDGCPASVCGGPHIEVDEVISPPLLQWPPAPAMVVAPMTEVGEANLTAALNYARHMYGGSEQGGAGD